MARLNAKIHEVIVVTLGPTGQAHLAPMGISEYQGLLQIKPFKPSATYDNLKHHPFCSINYIDDVRVFAGALTGRRDWPVKACQQIEGVFLNHALAHSEVKIDYYDDDGERACFYGEVIADYDHAPFRGYNRAQSAVIEAAILVSRLTLLPEQKIRDEIRYLRIAIDKTAGEREQEAWNWLMEKVTQAGINIE